MVDTTNQKAKQMAHTCLIACATMTRVWMNCNISEWLHRYRKQVTDAAKFGGENEKREGAVWGEGERRERWKRNDGTQCLVRGGGNA